MPHVRISAFFQVTKGFILYLLLRSTWFQCLCLGLWSISTGYLCMVWGRDWSSFSHHCVDSQMFQNNLLKTFFSPLDCLDPSDKNQVTTYVWVCSRTPHSSLSTYSALIMSVPLCRNLALQSLETRSCKFSGFVLSLTILQTILCIHFWLHWVFAAARAFSSCSEQGPVFTVVCGLLAAAASLVAGHRP